MCVTVVTEGRGRQGRRHVGRAPRVGTTVQAFDLARRFGIRVYEVEDLEPDVVYVEGQSLGFIRAGLSPSDRRWVADWLLSAALCDLSGLAP